MPDGREPPYSTRCSSCGTFPATHLVDRQGRRRLCCACRHGGIDPGLTRDREGGWADTDDTVDAMVDAQLPRDERSMP